ncbi:MAG: diguanylate cyclase domain-containing protein, partial [Actinomycetota bacterium]
ALEEIRASIGIAVFPAHGTKPEELLEHADQAMYHAKKSGGGYALFAPETAKSRRWFRRGSRGRVLGPGRRAMIGLSATLAILSGSMNQMSGPTIVRDDSATRLAAAVIALEQAPVEQVGTIVGDVEIAVAEISWTDVGQAEVVTALDALERSLVELRKSATTSIASRVNHLIATVQQAQVVGAVADDIPQVTIPTPEPIVGEASKEAAPGVPGSGPTP